MGTMLDTIQNAIIQEQEAEVQADTTPPDDAAIENQLTVEINSLWTDNLRLSGNRRATAKELRLVRTRLAERLYEMKSLLCRPDHGRASQWCGWLKQQGIPRSTADRLVARHGEMLGFHDETVPSGAASEPVPLTVEELAKDVWQRVGKFLSTGELVVRFIDRIAELSCVGHEWRPEGPMIFSPVRKFADGVTGTDAAAEITCPTPQPAESGEANPADAPAADPDPQLSDDIPAATD